MKRATALAVLLLAACAGTPETPVGKTASPEPVERVPFRESEYQAYAGPGTSTISGKVYLETIHGLKTGAGQDVVLNPVTSYSRQWYEQQYLKGRSLGPRDPRVERYVRRETVARDGNFEFTDVPAGEYYLVAPVIWKEPAKDGGKTRRREILAKRIVVHEESVEVMLTR